MFWLPIIAGATVGALTNKKDPLKGAILGGTLGYAGGTAFGAGAGGAGAGGAGGILGGATGTAATAAPASAGMGLGASAPGAAAFNQSMGLSALPGMGTIESAGLGTIGAGGTLYNPEYFANILGNPVYTGGGGLLSQIGTGAGSIFDTAKANIPDYLTPENMIGAASIISNTPQQQMQSAPAGGVSQGKTQGLNVDMGGARPISLRKREDF